jgi:hypothetical protein
LIPIPVTRIDCHQDQIKIVNIKPKKICSRLGYTDLLLIVLCLFNCARTLKSMDEPYMIHSKENLLQFIADVELVLMVANTTEREADRLQRQQKIHRWRELLNA